MKTFIVAISVVCVLILLACLAFRASRARSGSEKRDVAVATRGLHKPAILVSKTDTPTGSYFGGQPPSYSGFVWPTKDGSPLTFLACFDCAEIPRAPELDWLPARGHILFFYDMENQPWGFDPKDRGGWKTIYVAPEISISGSTAIPPPSLSGQAPAPLPRKFIAFRAAVMPPSWDSEEMRSIGLSDAEMDAFMDYRQTLFRELPHHQIGGYPDPVQSPEMAEECQLASNGVYCGNAAGYQDPRVPKLKAGAGEWQLLFQMDSDDDLKTMWGDAGMIYFWIKCEDARVWNFDDTWLILQCG